MPLIFEGRPAAGGLGLTNQQIGLYYGTFGAGAFLLGSLLAVLHRGRGLRRTLILAGVRLQPPFAVCALLAWFQPLEHVKPSAEASSWVLRLRIQFVGLTAFMMQQVAPGGAPDGALRLASGIA